MSLRCQKYFLGDSITKTTRNVLLFAGGVTWSPVFHDGRGSLRNWISPPTWKRMTLNSEMGPGGSWVNSGRLVSTFELHFALKSGHFSVSKCFFRLCEERNFLKKGSPKWPYPGFGQKTTFKGDFWYTCILRCGSQLFSTFNSRNRSFFELHRTSLNSKRIIWTFFLNPLVFFS